MAFPQQKKTGQHAPPLRKYGRPAQLFPRLLVEQLEERLVLANWSGDITADTTWSSGEVQHVVGNVHVAQGATLTVEPGTVIQFNGGTSLTVDGTLKAQGTSGQPIFFTSVRDNSPLGGSNTAGSRDWGCIQLNASSTGSILDHATIRYAGGTNDAAVSVNGAPLTLTNSTISDSYADGLRLLGSHAVVTGATFRNNGLPFGGAGIHIDPTSQPTVSGNTFVNNHINGVAVDGGSLSAGTTTWNNPDVVYHLYAPLTVPQGSTLAIGAGQVVKVDFRNSTDNLIVNGTLDAQGTAAQPVIFTSYRDDTAGGDTNNNGASSGITGDWCNLLFTSTSTNNVLNHVEVRYAGSGSVAAVIADRAPLTLSGGAIRDAYADGLRLLGSNAIITGVSFRNNGLLFGGAAIKADLSSTPIISDVQLSNNQTNGLQLEGGTLPGDTTWNNPAIVYVVRNEITIPAGVTLTIAPGQRVKASRFGGNVLLVAGTLDAQGTSAEPILFTSIADDTTGGDTDNSGSNTLPGAADWSGLEFTSTSTGNVLDHVEVRYAFAAGADQQAAIEVNGGTLTLRNSVIRDGVHDGLIAGPDAVVTVTSSIFTRVRRALLALAGSQLTAVNNTIDNNAIGVEADGTTATLTNNLITYSGSAGIRQTAPALLTLGFNDVFNPGASNYLGLADQTGTNGNLSQDPLYVDRSNRDYRLRVGSPAVAGQRVVILDSCRSGGFASSFQDDDKTLFLGSSKANEDSMEIARRYGLFTRSLLEALRTQRPDGNGGGVDRTLADAFRLAQIDVQTKTDIINAFTLGFRPQQNPVQGGKLQDVRLKDRGGEAANKIVLEALGGFLYQFFQIAKSLLLSAFDPNDKSAPAGAGPGRFLPAEQTLTYTVRFENQASATLPAAQVVVTDVLDSNLDWSTFRVLGVGFSNRDFLAPPDAPFFSTRVPLDDSGLGVALNVNLNPADGRLTATFDTVNFVTGQTPLDDLAGFLPPNDGTGLGEGYLRFTVRPRPGLPTGVRIENTALIVFDANPAIITNTEFNTLDRGTPTSAVTALPARATSADFTVNWSGSDDAGGSGIASYDVFVSTDGGPFLPFLVGTTQTSATFNGAPSHRYAFYSVATDHVGLRQARPSQAQAFTETPPAAGDDAYGVTASKTLRVSAPGVLGNDRAGDGPLTLTLLSTPTQGKLTLYADGSFVYKPRLTARGPDQFTYQVTDSAGRQSAVATVALLPLVSFRSAGQRQSESTTTVKIPVKLSIPSRQAVTVRYDVTAGTASNGTDYQLSSGVLTIPAGKSGRKIVFTVSNDRLHEANETIQVTLSDPGNAQLGTQTVFTYTIVNDDQAATLRSHPAPTPGAAAFVELFLPTAGNYPEPERTEDRKNTAANEAREDTSPTVLSCEADPFLGLVAGLLQAQSADESFSGLSVLDEVFTLYPLPCVNPLAPTASYSTISKRPL